VAVFVLAFAFFALPHALVAVTVATTLAPRAAHRWQVGDVQGVRKAVDGTLRVAIPLLILGGSGMIALAWPVTRVVGQFGQTASQGLRPIAHTLTAFGPGLLGYGVAFIMTKVLFALGEVRRASLLMIAGALVGAAWMGVASAVMASSERAAALALGYGAAQTVTAALLTIRVHRLTGSMGTRVAGRTLVESVFAGMAAVVVMLGLVALFGHGARQSLVALLVAGTGGVATFAAGIALLRWREVAGRRVQQPR
jgi:putative peptidoglycan lipid II flippase